VRRWRLVALLFALLACLAVPAFAEADGDPGSDVLVGQNLFAGELDLTAGQQLQLGDLLDATARLGAPVRVAIVSARIDLGAIPGAWLKPQLYASFLSLELKYDYAGRLLVVMPNGFGVAWTADRATGSKLAGQLDRYHPSSDAPAGYVLATTTAVQRIEAQAGIPAAKLTQTAAAIKAAGGKPGASASLPAGAPTATREAPPAILSSPPLQTGHGLRDGLLVSVLAIVLLVCAGSRFGWLERVGLRGRGRPPIRDGARNAGAAAHVVRRLMRPGVLVSVLLLGIVVAGLVIGPGRTAVSAASNPDLDAGSQIHPIRPAPSFTLTDETGHQVTLKQFRGKAVILAFIDAECQTLCPLTTEAMLDAKRSLGAAGKDVQLLGINVNWKSTQIDDVLNYTELHGLTRQWHFLTSSSLPALEKAWKSYGVNEQALIADDTNNIDHVAAVDLIDPQGRWRTVFTTQTAYAAIPQFGQIMAQDISKMLPGRPKVDSHYSYAQVKGIPPTQHITLPRVGGGHMPLGPGEPHLSLFFATWDTQTMGTQGLGHDLDELNQYNTYASTHKMPKVDAIDEGSVEPSPAALPAFLKTLKTRLDYPVAIDNSGKVADGYEVEGEPWFVLTSATGQIVWDQEVYTAGWPTLKQLKQQVRGALSKAPTIPITERAALNELKGSPAPLASIHEQESKLLPGGALVLYKRIHNLTKQGYAVVVNIWASDCGPCVDEFHLFAAASAIYGKKIAFLGADNEDAAGDARSFLRTHPVSYPSYATKTPDLGLLLTGGLEGTPTTVFISPNGKVIYAHAYEYKSQGNLDTDIEDYALGNAG
jgi:protein SCO1/2